MLTYMSKIFYNCSKTKKFLEISTEKNFKNHQFFLKEKIAPKAGLFLPTYFFHTIVLKS